MEPLIVQVIHRYHPEWEPPPDMGKEWTKCLCPFHGETRPSACVSFEHNAFKCFACGVKGDAASIIRQQEGGTYAAAQRVAEELSPGSNVSVPQESPRVSRRRVFGEPGPVPLQRPSPEVPSRVRGRSSPWT